MTWKRAIRTILRRNGFDIRRLPAGSSGDAYVDQWRLLRHRDVRRIVDVGALVGDTVAAYRALFPSAIIDCFEPSPASFEALNERFRADANVACHQAAIADRVGRCRLYCNQFSATNSLLRPSASHREYVGPDVMEPLSQIEVTCSTLDEFFLQRAIEQVSILKLDIQGGELRALEGCCQLLQAHRTELVYVEMLFAELYSGQAHYYQLCELLARFDYTLHGIYDMAYGQNGAIGWCDALFLSPQMRLSLESRIHG